MTSGITGRATRTGQAILVPDVHADSDFLGPIADITSEVCIPLFDQDRVFGALNVESTSGVRLGEADLRLLKALGEHINLAIQRARLYREERQNERKYRSVVESVHKVIFQSDALGAWTYLNPAWAQNHRLHRSPQRWASPSLNPSTRKMAPRRRAISSLC